MFTLRFDMRAPDGTAPAQDLYAAAIEMCAWAETRGAIAVVLSEHHGAEDGHLPSPLILASAIAARTRRCRSCWRRWSCPFATLSCSRRRSAFSTTSAMDASSTRSGLATAPKSTNTSASISVNADGWRTRTCPCCWSY